MSPLLHREIDVSPYPIVINARPEYRPGSLTEIAGYVARATITRLDGLPVYESYLAYQIYEGETFLDPQTAIRDGEQRAREDISTGFPH